MSYGMSPFIKRIKWKDPAASAAGPFCLFLSLYRIFQKFFALAGGELPV
jgi:hypothetical protein